METGSIPIGWNGMDYMNTNDDDTIALSETGIRSNIYSERSSPAAQSFGPCTDTAGVIHEEWPTTVSQIELGNSNEESPPGFVSRNSSFVSSMFDISVDGLDSDMSGSYSIQNTAKLLFQHNRRSDPCSFLGDEVSVSRGNYFGGAPFSINDKPFMDGDMLAVNLGGVHMPAQSSYMRTIPLLLSLDLAVNQLQHWVLGYTYGMIDDDHEHHPIDVRSMPIHNLVEGPDEDTGEMCHGWFCSYVLGYAVIDTYLYASNNPVVPDCNNMLVGRSLPVRYSKMHQILANDKGPSRWGGRVLVLKQNMLFEFASQRDVYNSRPVGFLTLCGATIEPFESNPCALSIIAMRVPMTAGTQDNVRGINSHNFIEVILGAPCASKRDLWVDTLRSAAVLKEMDLYEFIDTANLSEDTKTDSTSTALRSLLDGCEGSLLGQSPFCRIYAARRNVPGSKYCAIKCINTTDFFQAVANHTERYDAIMREVLLQGILSVKKCESGFNPSVRLLGAFETEKAIFIEMELMSNVDLFDRISRKGVS